MRFDRRAPCQASGTRPSPRRPARSSGACGNTPRPRRAGGASPSRPATRPPARAPRARAAGPSPFHAIELGTSRRPAPPRRGPAWRSIRWRVASRATSRQRSGRSPGCATSRNLSMPVVGRLGERLPGRAVGVARARVAGVGGGVCTSAGTHVRDARAWTPWPSRGAHGAAHQRRLVQLELAPGRPRGRRQVRVLVARPRLRLAVPARVVRGQPIAALRQRARTLNDVPPRGRAHGLAPRADPRRASGPWVVLPAPGGSSAVPGARKPPHP